MDTGIRLQDEEVAMRDPAGQFLTDQEREKIRSAVVEAERMTSGEIVPMVVSESYEYPMADVLGGVAISLPLALLITPLVGRWFWIGAQNMWLFLAFFIALFFIFYQVVKRTRWLKRFFVSPSEIEEEVEEAAVVNFFREGLYRTREETGVLILVSLFEHRVWILADRGINEKVDKGKWSEIVQGIVAGIKQGRQADAICEAVKQTGDLLKTHFPKRADDTDELKNLL
ncbi:MAG: TPM domain-containing protein [Desulfobacterales bacterium]|nr:TPM domain-containing protein [Desulfobacterales bacterium]